MILGFYQRFLYAFYQHHSNALLMNLHCVNDLKAEYSLLYRFDFL